LLRSVARRVEAAPGAPVHTDKKVYDRSGLCSTNVLGVCRGSVESLYLGNPVAGLPTRGSPGGRANDVDLQIRRRPGISGGWARRRLVWLEHTGFGQRLRLWRIEVSVTWATAKRRRPAHPPSA